jgi:hypothetical protein
MTAQERPRHRQDDTLLVIQSSASLAEQKVWQRLRQEQATFDQKRVQDARWFVLRMAMGILAMLVIPAMIVICALIIFDSHQDVTVKGLAASTLLVDILGLMGAVWRVILNPASVSQLAPVTAPYEVPPANSDETQDDSALTMRNSTRTEEQAPIRQTREGDSGLR